VEFDWCADVLEVAGPRAGIMCRSVSTTVTTALTTSTEGE